MAVKASAAKAQDVEAFLASLDHPFKQEILVLRRVILGADPSIAESIKWNAPSFYTSEHFATMQLRAKDGVQVIMHLGAKPSASASTGIAIDDPQLLLTWLAKDRASVTFRSLQEIDIKSKVFTSIICQWLKYV
ncbi:MAG TPA: DUF1801 domain-containing protein [Roseiflexaceae bacterium]|nr:DUF1801 domain-containing protein [Roseiflexaceae bacterium]